MRRLPAGKVCDAGLPPGVQVRFLPSGNVCAGSDQYERVMLEDVPDAGRAVELPEWAAIARLCRRGLRTPSPPHRWWLPTIGLLAQRSLQWSPDRAGFSDTTTFWLTLSFPFPSGQRAPAPPDRRTFDELCAASRRLNRMLATVDDAKLRTRARVQLMAWLDELESLVI